MTRLGTGPDGIGSRGTTRRAFLRRLAGAAPLAALAAACGGRAPDRAAILARARAYDPSLDCTSTTGLFPAEIRTRTDNAYTDRSPHEDRFCFTCANFVAPPQEGACAGCTTVKGPVHPLGWCEAWAEGRSPR